jgi:hypothetical protein
MIIVREKFFWMAVCLCCVLLSSWLIFVAVILVRQNEIENEKMSNLQIEIKNQQQVVLILNAEMPCSKSYTVDRVTDLKQDVLGKIDIGLDYPPGYDFLSYFFTNVSPDSYVGQMGLKDNDFLLYPNSNSEESLPLSIILSRLKSWLILRDGKVLKLCYKYRE